MSGTVIVGASHAGVEIAAAMREAGDRRPITVIGSELHMPYQRPPLSKSYLAGEVSSEALMLRSPVFYRRSDIRLLLGESVCEVDAHRKVLTTSAGRAMPFAQMALATGARTRRLSVPGADLPGVFYLRDLDDAGTLAARLPGAKRAVVVGGGFIGLEAAAVLKGRGLSVEMVEAAPRLMTRSVSGLLSDWIHRLHVTSGVHIHLGAAVREIEGADHGVTSVVLEDGRSLEADLVVIGVGVIPNVELAQQMGLAVNSGVLVDSACRSSMPGVVAAGDVAEGPHPLGGEPLRIESIQNASDQARRAAATLVGTEVPRAAPPWFWSDQYTTKLQTIGAPATYDDVVVRGSLNEGKFSLLWYSHGRLTGAECVNSPADFAVVRKAMALGVNLEGARARDTHVKLRELLAG